MSDVKISKRKISDVRSLGAIKIKVYWLTVFGKNYPIKLTYCTYGVVINSVGMIRSNIFFN